MLEEIFFWAEFPETVDWNLLSRLLDEADLKIKVFVTCRSLDKLEKNMIKNIISYTSIMGWPFKPLVKNYLRSYAKKAVKKYGMDKIMFSCSFYDDIFLHFFRGRRFVLSLYLKIRFVLFSLAHLLCLEALLPPRSLALLLQLSFVTQALLSR